MWRKTNGNRCVVWVDHTWRYDYGIREKNAKIKPIYSVAT